MNGHIMTRWKSVKRGYNSAIEFFRENLIRK